MPALPWGAQPASAAIGAICFRKRVKVPRYYFHFSDGQRRFSDDKGQELSGLSAVRTHAVQQVRDLKAAMCDPGIQDLSGWTMTVVDNTDRTVFEIGFDLKPHRTDA